MKKIFFYFSVSINIIIVFLFLMIYLGGNPLNKSISFKLKVGSIFPQGWAFFTRDSREPRIYGFYYDEYLKKYVEINQRNMSLQNHFGLGRKIRLVNSELGYYIQKIEIDSLSHKYEQKENNIYNLIDVKYQNYNTLELDFKKTPNLKRGKYLMIIQYMLPWQLISKDNTYPSTMIVYPIELK